MTAKECIMGRRSIRKFKDTPVDHEVVNEIIEAASYAPSWKHSQIARYAVSYTHLDVYKRQVSSSSTPLINASCSTPP